MAIPTFIQVTHWKSDTKVAINLDHISSFGPAPYEEGSMIWVRGQDTSPLHVVETYETIAQTIDTLKLYDKI